MPAPPTETELKLQLAPAHVDRFRRSAALSKSACTEVDIDNVYFDTRDRLLQRHRMALRVRQIGRRWLQTLKTEGKGGGALSLRGEWETPAQVVRGRGRLDLAQFSESPLPDLLAKQKAGRTAARVSTRVRRAPVDRRARRCHDRSRARYRGDQRRGWAKSATRTDLRSRAGTEAPAKSARAGGADRFGARAARRGGKAPLALTPVVRSKAERGYQLASQRSATGGQGVCKGIRRKRNAQRNYSRCAADGGRARPCGADREHRALAALRRSRIRAPVARCLTPRPVCNTDSSIVSSATCPQSLMNELRWFARALGEARDWDVITDETLPSLTEGIGADAMKLLVTRADARRRRARADIRKAAQSTRYAALVLNGERWCMTPAPAGGIARRCGVAGSAKRVEETVQSGAVLRSADTVAAARSTNPCEAIALCARFVFGCAAEAGDCALHRCVV